MAIFFKIGPRTRHAFINKLVNGVPLAEPEPNASIHTEIESKVLFDLSGIFEVHDWIIDWPRRAAFVLEDQELVLVTKGCAGLGVDRRGKIQLAEVGYFLVGRGMFFRPEIRIFEFNFMFHLDKCIDTFPLTS
jgi:hypothetical protein